MTDSSIVPDSTAAAHAGPPTAILVNRCEVRLWSLPQEERLRRALARCGITDVRAGGEGPAAAAGSVILLRTDFLLEDSLIKALVRTRECLLTATQPDGGRAAVAAHSPRETASRVMELLRQPQSAPQDLAALDLAIKGPAELGATYDQALRRRVAPFALSLTAGTQLAAERQLFRASYKGITDFVTKWLWPWPAFWTTRWCAARGISANMVTAASLVLVLVALWLFARGYFGVGLIAAWLMTFLDTVDGKLARVTLTSSRLGNVFDHGIDLLHPPFWYVAWYFGLAAGATPTQALLLAGAVWTVVMGYVVGRLQEGFFLWRHKFEMHAWRPLDSAFRLFTARRNPNLAILTAATIAGRPDLGLQVVAIWTLLCLAFHFWRIAQAERHRSGGGPVRSWLAETPATPS
jgi:phosphatidylglycerophosphate synthase